MRKELLKPLFIQVGALCQLVLFLKAFYDWVLGIQPSNFTVMMVLLLTILLENKYKN